MPRVLVVIPNDSYRAADFVAAAEALSVEIAIASEERPPLRPDDRFVRIDCSSPEWSAQEIAALASRTPIDAVIAADDAGVEIASLASEAMGLTASSPSAAAATLDKAVTRRLLAVGEVPQPDFLLLGNDDDPRRAAAAFDGPVVIKPTMLSASRGVLRVDSPSEAAAVVTTVRAIVERAGRDHTAPLLLEHFIDGPEVSVEGIVWDGELEILAVFDKPLPMDGPAFQETIFITPSRMNQSVLTEVERVTAAAVSALGLTEGPVHAELRIEDGRPMVIEVAGRTIGGLCGRALRFGLLGAPLETMVLRHALGMRKSSMHREPAASGVLMIPIPKPGTLLEITGLDEVRSMAGVVSVEITAPLGTEVAPPPYGDRYLGFVFARADDPTTVERTLRAAMDAIEVTVG
jgi:biotin carboxylase